jgi:type IV pilus assembly protein PilC
VTTFTYIALDSDGRKKNGLVEAVNQDAAISRLAGEGRFVLEISEQKGPRVIGGGSPAATARGKGRAGKGDIALFTRRMADLAAAGLPLDRVLQVVAEQSESGQLVVVAEDALEQVRGGMPVSEALARHPKIFPDVYSQTLRAGEASGQFPEVATRLADFQEKEVARRSQIVSALIYPAMLTMTAVGVVIFLLTFVVPRLSDMFADLGGDLPTTTQILLAVTGAITEHWVLILGAIAALVVAYRAWSATESGALTRDGLLLQLPMLGPVLRKATVSRFARVLGTLVFGGVPILEAIRLAGLASGNRVFHRSAIRVEEEVREGRSIADAMRDAGAFPPVLTHMVAIGEETGDLPKMLGRVSDSLDFEVDNGLRRLTSTIEPVIMLVMGAFVGFVVLSVVLPIFQAQELVK